MQNGFGVCFHAKQPVIKGDEEGLTGEPKFPPIKAGDIFGQNGAIAGGFEIGDLAAKLFDGNGPDVMAGVFGDMVVHQNGNVLSGSRTLVHEEKKDEQTSGYEQESTPQLLDSSFHIESGQYGGEASLPSMGNYHSSGEDEPLWPL